MLLASVKTNNSMVNGYQVGHTLELYQWADSTFEVVDYNYNLKEGHEYRDPIGETNPNATVAACLAALVDIVKPYGADGLELVSRLTSRLQAEVNGTPNQQAYCLAGALE